MRVLNIERGRQSPVPGALAVNLGNSIVRKWITHKYLLGNPGQARLKPGQASLLLLPECHNLHICQLNFALISTGFAEQPWLRLTTQKSLQRCTSFSPSKKFHPESKTRANRTSTAVTMSRWIFLLKVDTLKEFTGTMKVEYSQ